jgi:branched-chain amino acid transport system substrate-binding protein
MNEKVRELVMASAQIVGEECHPLDRMDDRETVERITASAADVVFNTIVPPGLSCLCMSLRVR